jgi:hypothetical protein
MTCNSRTVPSAPITAFRRTVPWIPCCLAAAGYNGGRTGPQSVSARACWRAFFCSSFAVAGGSDDPHSSPAATFASIVVRRVVDAAGCCCARTTAHAADSKQAITASVFTSALYAKSHPSSTVAVVSRRGCCPPLSKKLSQASDKKCPPKSRASFIGHPSAMKFLRTSRRWVFQQHRRLHSDT